MDPKMIEFLKENKENIVNENYQVLFNNYSKFVVQNAAFDFIMDPVQDLAVLLIRSGISPTDILSKLTEIPSFIGYYWPEKRLFIPDNIERIHGAAFADNNNITDIIVPNSVIHIGNSAFDVNDLEYIKLPKRFKDQLDDIYTGSLEGVTVEYY